jgi:hypothetical protein
MKSEGPVGNLIAAAEVHPDVNRYKTVIHAAGDERCEAVCQSGLQLLPTFSRLGALPSPSHQPGTYR